MSYNWKDGEMRYYWVNGSCDRCCKQPAVVRNSPSKQNLCEPCDTIVTYAYRTMELRQEIRRLKEEILHLKYKPDGPGYEEAKAHFEQIKQ